jgi:phosphopantetheine--protein transferase-like protein
MSIKGIGIDICQLSRIKSFFSDHDNQTLSYLFTKNELTAFNHFKEKPLGMSIAFSAKESVGKIFKTGLGGLNWYDTEILFSMTHKKLMNIMLHGKTKDIAKRKSINALMGSWSVAGDYVVTLVVGF